MPTICRCVSYCSYKITQRPLSAHGIGSGESPYHYDSTKVTLSRRSNQALGIAHYAIDFIRKQNQFHPDRHAAVADEVLERVQLFHTDSVLCALSAIAMQTNSPLVLRKEALANYRCYKRRGGAYLFGSDKKVSVEKAILANTAAVREWDSNGTVFGYNADLPGHRAGEFGHNDYYPVVIAANEARNGAMSFKDAMRAMLCLDEIRGRLAEVFSLKSYKIDHVVYGAIASAAVYGAIVGATAEQIESAIGMTVAHYIPWRAIRAGHQLSDSKGASAALSTEVAIMSVNRSMMGFQGPKDIFRNPEAIFCYFNKTPSDGESPFDVVLAHDGSNFAVMGMHFKLGLYEHQSAGAIQGLINLLVRHPEIIESADSIGQIVIKAYQPAFGIIGDAAKRNPQTRQSADHSMVYIISRLLRRATLTQRKGISVKDSIDVWRQWMLSPLDYSCEAIHDTQTRARMQKIHFQHGGKEYDSKYPEGIPTHVEIRMSDGRTFSSGLVMYPLGHARNTDPRLKDVLQHKFQLLGTLAMTSNRLIKFFKRLRDADNVYGLYRDIPKLNKHLPIDSNNIAENDFDFR